MTQSTQPPRFKLKISVYDLLPPDTLSNIIWAWGASLLRTGIAIGEYAFGGHDDPNLTGV